MPNVHSTLKSLFEGIANAIRTKKGTSAKILADNFPSEILTIETELDPLTAPATAADILAGKEAYGDDGEAITGTLVPPVDTGANGLYKDMIEGLAENVYDTQLTSLSSFRRNYSALKSIIALNATSDTYYGTSANLETYIVPKLASMTNSQFQGCSKLLNFWCPLAINSNSAVFSGCTRLEHLFLNWRSISANNFPKPSALKSVTFKQLSDLSNFSNVAPSLETLIVLSSTTRLNSVATLNGFLGTIYVHNADLSWYISATNWTTYASQIVGIDEDTTATAGTQFTPTTSATVDHWDQVDLQSYSVGTIDTTNGSITPTHDGRLLIRGLDANDEIVHVTYLQIGTGFDEEANLA